MALAELRAPVRSHYAVWALVAAAVGIATGLVAMGLNTSRANTFAAVELP